MGILLGYILHKGPENTHQFPSSMLLAAASYCSWCGVWHTYSSMNGEGWHNLKMFCTNMDSANWLVVVPVLGHFLMQKAMEVWSMISCPGGSCHCPGCPSWPSSSTSSTDHLYSLQTSVYNCCGPFLAITGLFLRQPDDLNISGYGGHAGCRDTFCQTREAHLWQTTGPKTSWKWQETCLIE